MLATGEEVDVTREDWELMAVGSEGTSTEGAFASPVLGIFPSLHGTYISFMGWLMHSPRFSKHLKVGASVVSVLSGAFPSS